MNESKKETSIILVVDDHSESLSMINMALDPLGMTVLIALNGEQALAVLQQVTPDVILMDAVMPVMDGFACSRVIRETLPLTPIIFMTGLSEVEHIVEAFEAGGNDYIIKPFKPEELRVRIQQHQNNAEMLHDARLALDTAKQYVFSVNKEGEILWTTPEAQKSLDITLKTETLTPALLNKKIKTWLPNGRDGHDLALPTQGEPYTVRYFKQSKDNEYLLKIQAPNNEVDPSVLEKSLGITHREAEVLLWVAHGKTNQEIGDILDIRPRTVNKHLEQIYPKIGADNRTAAAATTIQCLLGVSLGKPT